jgi:hypothetical protein
VRDLDSVATRSGRSVARKRRGANIVGLDETKEVKKLDTRYQAKKVCVCLMGRGGGMRTRIDSLVSGRTSQVWRLCCTPG